MGINASDVPDGPVTLDFRPRDIELLDGCGGCIAGTVLAVAGASPMSAVILLLRQPIEAQW